MKILVYNIAAENGGALTILNQFYAKAKNEHKDIEWLFVVSIAQLEECENIKVVKYPEVKKSWIRRYFFDKYKAPEIIKDYNPDIVLNLQNICIKCKSKQILYMHQSIPFIDYKFSLKSKKMWVYQNIIGRMIKKSCKKADEIIVQTNWIKEAIIKQTKVNSHKISIQPPKIDEDKIIKYVEQEEKQYFFPANSSVYKNHKVIIDALKILAKIEIFPKIMFTLMGDETEDIKLLKNEAYENNLNIEWLGNISYDKMFSIYSKSTLIFPSFVETFGLPLLEARMSNCPIIAADTSFAKEICDGYENVRYFDKSDSFKLSKLINS